MDNGVPCIWMFNFFRQYFTTANHGVYIIEHFGEDVLVVMKTQPLSGISSILWKIDWCTRLMGRIRVVMECNASNQSMPKLEPIDGLCKPSF